MRGRSPYPSARAARMAAPVGVTSSTGTPREYMGAPRNSSTTAGPGVHRDLGGPDAEGLHLVHLEVERFHRKGGQLLADRVEVRPGIEQGPQGHIAGDPGDAVEVGDAHPATPPGP